MQKGWIKEICDSNFYEVNWISEGKMWKKTIHKDYDLLFHIESEENEDRGEERAYHRGVSTTNLPFNTNLP
jgi:hypothetical protein